MLFKSSPFATQSHGHNIHNSFQLNAYGEALLPARVFRDPHGRRFHNGWCHTTISQNAVLVDSRGQIQYTPAPHGRIVEERPGPDWDSMAGDAADAHGSQLARFHRHLLFA